jgi:hypothetical protein
MNAVRHGLAARACLLPGENAEELAELAAEMEADLRPCGAAQRELVGRIVSLSWRLRRLAGAEQALWAHEERQALEAWHRSGQAMALAADMMGPLCGARATHRPPPPAPATGEQFVARQFSTTGGGNGSSISALERLAVYEQRLDRALHGAFRQFQQLRKMQREEEQLHAEIDGHAAPHGATFSEAVVQNEATAPDEHSNVPGNVGISGTDDVPIADASAAVQNEATACAERDEIPDAAKATESPGASATAGEASCSVQNEPTASWEIPALMQQHGVEGAIGND